MKLYLTFSFMLCSFLMFSQQSNCIFHADSSSVWIQGNDIRAKIMAGTFNFGFDYGFQVPYDSSRAIQQNAFGNSSLWFAGLEQNSGNLLKYSPLLNNSLGALDNLGNLDSNFCAFYNKVWMVESYMIEDIIQQYVNTGLVTVVDSSVLAWPGRNNPYFQSMNGAPLMTNRDFAPFFDRNLDGVYNPYDGDYPVFKDGDPNAIAAAMTWSISNSYDDYGGTGNSMKVEFHQLHYALFCQNNHLLDKTLFAKTKIVGRGNPALYNTRFSIVFNPALGCYLDDYIGTDSLNHAMYVYNSDEYDDTTGICYQVGYGYKPPVFSIKLLNQQLARSIYFDNSNDPVRGNPGSQLQYYRLMNGYWLDGRPFSYGGTGDNGSFAAKTNFVFPDPPFDSLGWSMHTMGIFGSDYKGVLTVDFDSFFVNDIKEIEYAYVYHRDMNLADNIDMTNLVFQELPILQSWYDTGFPITCLPNISSAEKFEKNENIRLFPNPNNGAFKVVLPQVDDYDITIYNISGQIIYQSAQLNTEQIDVNFNAADGIYFLHIKNPQGTLFNGKLMLKNN